MSKDKRLYVQDEELGSALACTKREGNTLSTIIRSAWDSGNLDPLTKNNKISVKGAHIGIVSHITLHELNLKMNDTEAFNGFANRFLWVSARRKRLVPMPPPMPEDELNKLQIELKSIFESVRELKAVTLSPEATVLWILYYNELSAEHPGLAGSVLNRAEAQVLRIAMVYALLDKSDQINVVHLQAAFALWDYCEKSAKLIFKGREVDRILQKIIDCLRTGPKTKTELHKEFSNHLKRGKLDSALDELIRTGRIVDKKVATGAGPPKWVYELKEP